MKLAFPHSCVTDYEALIPAMTNDERDRHVLAACVVSPADTLVTFNLDDFSTSATEPHGITVVGPDQFLLDQLDLHPDKVRLGISEMLRRNKMPPQDIGALADHLDRSGVEGFAAEVRRSANPLA